MHRVVEHIDAHLDEPLDLARLAEVANFSPFHFHRLFAAWMGETCGEYLRRRRLEVAALRLLAHPRLPVLQAALGVGFGSGEAFARAFRAHFGAAPSTWRRTQRGGGGPPGRAAGTAPGPDRRIDGDEESSMTVDVRVIQLPAESVAYLRYQGPYGPPVSRFWMETVAPWMAVHGLLARPMYGIAQDDPDITPPAKCRYDAALLLEPGEPVPPPAFGAKLPGGRYAVLAFEGTAVQVNTAWRRLMRGWLPDSGYQLDGRPCFERYPPGGGYDPATGGFRCEICIPVAPL